MFLFWTEKKTKQKTNQQKTSTQTTKNVFKTLLLQQLISHKEQGKKNMLQWL